MWCGDVDQLAVSKHRVIRRRFRGDIAQMEERLLCKQRVAGSNPVISTNERMIALRTLKAVRFSLCLAIALLLSAILPMVRTTKEPVILPDVISSARFVVSAAVLSQKQPVSVVSQASSIAQANQEVQPSPTIYETISFDEEMQRLVWQACEETGCPYELALSVIWNESMYQNITGDNGNSIGYMQIQPRWNQARMERLGVSDLSDPLSNFRVGCDLLAELLEKYSLEEALTCYNTGSPGQSHYANRVMEYMEDTFSK